ncbi:uncharacterized protein VTP21DRAFT_7801 [Calcarisporiella thermophila]|uniref:uncharacterized protein n=1 Tax=Calcarisporiella thermophila TaxID=911321 RepID=UPI003744010D
MKYIFALFTFLAILATTFAKDEKIRGLVNRDGSVTNFGVKRTTTKRYNIGFYLTNFPDCAKYLYIRVNPVNAAPFDWRRYQKSDENGPTNSVIGVDVLAGTTFTLDAKISPAVTSSCDTHFEGFLGYV